MIRSLVSACLRVRLLVVGLAAALLAVGATQLHDMPVDVLPEFGPTTVEVQTEALGLSAPEVEQLITVPMEQDLLNGVAFLKDIRSQSVAGLSRILLVFEPGTNLYRARQLVAERLTQAYALPNVSKPPQMLQPQSSTNRVLIVGVTSRTVSPIEMSVLARWTIVPRLMGVPGVANVAIWGQRDRELDVQVDPGVLHADRVSLSQVIRTTGNALWFSPLTYVQANTPGTGGLIDTPNQRLGIQHFSPITTPATLAKVPIEGREALRLGDVASVIENHQQPLIGDAVVGKSGGLLLVVEKFPGSSTLSVTKGVERALQELQPGLSGMRFDTHVYRPASYVETAIGNLGRGLIAAGALLALAFAAFVLRLRTVVLALAGIALSLVAAALVLFAVGETMNLMVLAGLVAAVVIVVDEAVVDVEAVGRSLRRRGRGEVAERVREESLAARGGAVYGTLVVVLATLPLFFLHGEAGSFFPHVAIALLVAVGAATVVALTVTPALAVLLLSKAGPPRDSPLVRRLRRPYGRALSRLLAAPQPLYLGLAVLAAAGIATAPFLRQSLLPTLKERTLLIQWAGPAATSLPEMDRITARAARELRGIRGVDEVSAHVGRAVTADQVVGVNSGELWVTVDPHADYATTIAAVKRVVVGYPGFSGTVGSFSNERVRDVLAGTDADLTVRIYGEDLRVLSSTAARVERALAGVASLSDRRVRLPAEEPSIQIGVRLDAADRYGLKPGDVRRAAATLLSGIAVGSLFQEQKVFDVVVRSTPPVRSSLTSIRQLAIDTPGGRQVRLGQVASVRIAPTPSTISREAVARYVDVTASVHGSVGAATAQVDRALARVAFPGETHAEVIAAQAQPFGRLAAVAVAAALGIFLLLQAALASWRLAALAFALLPLAVVGGLLAAAAVGDALSFGSYAGLLAVLGLAARNAVLQIRGLADAERGAGGRTGRRAVVRGAQERLSPTLLAAVAIAVALAPLAAAGSPAGYEIVHPLAVVVLGGVATSTLVSLFATPVLYARVGGPRGVETGHSPADVLRRRVRGLGRSTGGSPHGSSHGTSASATRARQAR